MDSSTASYRGHRFPAEIISHAVWLYHRFCLSFRDVEDLLAERGVTVSYETIRHWCGKFGTEYATSLKRRERRLGDTWHLDELFVTNALWPRARLRRRERHVIQRRRCIIRETRVTAVASGTTSTFSWAA
jgi:hypothetical protein